MPLASLPIASWEKSENQLQRFPRGEELLTGQVFWDGGNHKESLPT